MTVCGVWIRLEKKDGIAEWTIITWEKREKIIWADFAEVMSQVKISVWCYDNSNHRCKCNDCSIVRVYKDWRKTILALI